MWISQAVVAARMCGPCLPSVRKRCVTWMPNDAINKYWYECIFYSTLFSFVVCRLCARASARPSSELYVSPEHIHGACLFIILQLAVRRLTFRARHLLFAIQKKADKIYSKLLYVGQPWMANEMATIRSNYISAYQQPTECRIGAIAPHSSHSLVHILQWRACIFFSNILIRVITLICIAGLFILLLKCSNKREA